MKRNRPVPLPVFLVLFFQASCFAWGPAGHALINRYAVRLMPPPMDSFFLSFSDSLAALGAEPDEWRKADTTLKNHHFIDMDLLDTYPFAGIPHRYKAAEKRYGKSRLQKAGILPWAIALHYNSLVAEFPKGRWDALRKDLLALAHYIGDGHQPFHTTLNYNGEQTGNRGIHFRYEIDLLERFPGRFSQLPEADLRPPSQKISDLNGRTFAFLLDANAGISPANEADIGCRSAFPGDTVAYWECFEQRIGAEVRRRLAQAASQTAAYWYSAWLQAKKPVLPPPTQTKKR